MAARMANSFCREEARASSRLAMSTHAMSSTSTTAANSTSSASQRFSDQFFLQGATINCRFVDKNPN